MEFLETGNFFPRQPSSSVISTCKQDVLWKQPKAHSNHEEADIMLHVVYAVKEGYTKIQTRKVNTDVLFLVITTTEMLNILEREWLLVQKK